MATSKYGDVGYEVEDGLAWITIDRQERRNAFTTRTIRELTAAFRDAWSDRSVGVVVLTGAGDRAFSAGGDVKEKRDTDAHSGMTSLDEIEVLHWMIRSIPKPVIAAVNGDAIGGGHVLHVLCDITIAADHARFGQNGPNVGSWDAGFGTGLLARAAGEKRAREIWYFCRRYDAQTMFEWGLVNAVVPIADLRAEVRRWGDELLAKSPTAITFLKHAFVADSEYLSAIGRLTGDARRPFVHSEEAREGQTAFLDKRTPDFSRFR